MRDHSKTETRKSKFVRGYRLYFQPAMRIAAAAFLFSIFACPSFAQFTLVSGTVTDPNGLPWACGTISATLINNNGVSATLNGVSFSGFTAPVKLGCPTDPTTSRTPGAFQMQLADNTQIKCGIATCGVQTTWSFTANTTGIAPPQGTGPQSFTNTFTVSGSSQTLSFTGVPAISLASGAASNQPNVINPTLAPYNAPLTQSCTFSALTVTSGSNVVSCTAATFTSADIGKITWVSCCGGIGGQNKASSVLIQAQGVIHDIISPTSVHICTTTATCTPVNATANASAGAIFYWGFKATAAVQAAIAATYAGPGPCSTFFWSGWLMIDKGIGNGPANCIVPIGATGDTNLSILGTGRANSVLLMSPDFDFTTGAGNSCGGLNVVTTVNNICFLGLQGIERKYFGINGGGRSNTGANSVVILDAQVDDFDFDIGLSDIGAADATMICYQMDGNGAYPNFVEVDGCGSNPIVINSGQVNTLMGGYAADSLGTANNTAAMVVKNGAVVTSSQMMWGPGNSGTGFQVVNVQAGGAWYSTNDTCITGTGTNCILNNGGEVHLTNFTASTAFGLTPARTVASSASGAKTYITNSHLYGATNPVLVTAGTVFIDDKTTFSGAGTNSGLAPTCAATTGGTACALVAGSTNEKGTVRITASAVATGTVTLTFAGTFAGGSGATPSCTFNYANTGANAWSLTTTTPIVMTTRSSTAPVFNWNQTGALSAGGTYDIDYVCVAR